MTKNEKTALQNLFNEYTNINKERDHYFVALQNLARENNKTVYCSVNANVKQFLDTEYEDRALYLLEKYNEATGKLAMCEKLGTTLAEVNFWK